MPIEPITCMIKEPKEICMKHDIYEVKGVLHCCVTYKRYSYSSDTVQSVSKRRIFSFTNVTYIRFGLSGTHYAPRKDSTRIQRAVNLDPGTYCHRQRGPEKESSILWSMPAVLKITRLLKNPLFGGYWVTKNLRGEAFVTALSYNPYNPNNLLCLLR